jgi:HK97 family phage prohead protease
MNVEYITVPLELKSLEGNQFEGYGSTFGNVDYGGDAVVKGAFAESLDRWKKEGEWPQMFWMHRPDQIPGKWLDMREDAKGLWTKGEALPTTVGNDVQILMRARAVRALSIGFSIDSAKDVEFRDGVRLLKRINLWEVSPVSMPMNPKAKIGAVKSMLHSKGVSISDFKRELEEWFHAKGLSKSQAVAFSSRALALDDVSEINFGVIPKNRDEEEGGETVEEPVTPRSDSGEADEEKAVLAALAALNDKLLGESLMRRIR